MRRAALAALAGAAFAAAAPARADTVPVTVLFQAFSPAQLVALPGDTLQWTNASERVHTVTADNGSFDSGSLASGSTFSTVAGAPGAYTYHCTIHAGMTGEFDVYRVTLVGLPQTAVPAGDKVAVSGRTADPQSPVTIERDTGAGFKPVTSAQPAADGTWSAQVTADRTADYRATTGLDASQTQRLLVLDRHVSITPTKNGVRVTVNPPLPYGHLLLERDTRERFGWFPVARKRLDYLSRAAFRIRRPATVRVAIVDIDGWSPLATSAPLHLRASG
jgi:plastocyanin